MDCDEPALPPEMILRIIGEGGPSLWAQGRLCNKFMRDAMPLTPCKGAVVIRSIADALAAPPWVRRILDRAQCIIWHGNHKVPLDVLVPESAELRCLGIIDQVVNHVEFRRSTFRHGGKILPIPRRLIITSNIVGHMYCGLQLRELVYIVTDDCTGHIQAGLLQRLIIVSKRPGGLFSLPCVATPHLKELIIICPTIPGKKTFDPLTCYCYGNRPWREANILPPTVKVTVTDQPYYWHHGIILSPGAYAVSGQPWIHKF